jgi:hypothetical protein
MASSLQQFRYAEPEKVQSTVLLRAMPAGKDIQSAWKTCDFAKKTFKANWPKDQYYQSIRTSRSVVAGRYNRYRRYSTPAVQNKRPSRYKPKISADRHFR